MKLKLVFGFLSLLLLSLPVRSQTSNGLPFTAVTPPPPPVLSSLGGLSTSGKIYTGAVMPINGTGFTASCVVNVDGTAQASSTYSFSSATLINFTIPASLGSSAGTAHTLTVTCPQAVLSMMAPVTLPNATVGVLYTANLSQLAQVQGGVPPYTFSLSSGSLPTGLSLSPSTGTISGTPTGAGSFAGTLTVSDSSGLALKIEKLNFRTLPVGAVEIASRK